jgi:hypothetical protein
MIGRLIAWIVEQVHTARAAIEEAQNDKEENKLIRKANKLLDQKLKRIEHKEKRAEILDKIDEIEGAEYDDDDEDDNQTSPSTADELFANIALNALPMLLQGKTPTPSDESAKSSPPPLPPAAIDTIKKCQSPQELKNKAQKFFPQIDDSTAEALYLAYH